MSIVAVSNGRYLLGKGLGGQIDQFDEVLRFNDAPTEGYSDDVGTKTTIRAFTGTEMDFSRFDCRRLWWMPNRGHNKLFPPLGVEVIPVEVEDHIASVTGMTEFVWPTTGLVALVYLLREFETIYLAGWFKGEAAWRPGVFVNHYDGAINDPDLTWLTCHIPKLESRFIQSLMDEGRLIDVELQTQQERKM